MSYYSTFVCNTYPCYIYIPHMNYSIHDFINAYPYINQVLPNAGTMCSVRELYMAYSCIIHVHPKSYPSPTHVLLMSYSFPTHILYMSYPCPTHVLPISYPCPTHVLPIDTLMSSIRLMTMNTVISIAAY